MKMIFLWAAIVGVAGIAGVATLTNVIDVNGQSFGIFDFTATPSSSCTVDNGLGRDCMVSVEPSGATTSDEQSNSIVNVEPHGDASENGIVQYVDDNDVEFFDEEFTSFEGCSPSSWGSAADLEEVDFSAVSWPAGYFPDDKYGYPAYFNQLIVISSGEDPTLHEALQSKGGGINKLARHSVAALLNSANSEIDYPLSITDIISNTQDSIEKEDYSFADVLAFSNNLGKENLCDKLG